MNLRRDLFHETDILGGLHFPEPAEEEMHLHDGRTNQRNLPAAPQNPEKYSPPLGNKLLRVGTKDDNQYLNSQPQQVRIKTGPRIKYGVLDRI